MSDEATRGQVSADAARAYEEFLVPALFTKPARRISESSDIAPGIDVLDVACGTGILTRTVAATAGAAHVTGLDPNDGMLAVARKLSPDIAWRQGVAEALPYDDARFDRTFCQFGLMFFEDRVHGLREMARVLRPGGAMAVAVWGSLGENEGYAAMTELLDTMFGKDVADALRAPFALGEDGVLDSLAREAGLHDARVETIPLVTEFPSLDEWVRINIKAWTLADMIDDDQFAALQEASRTHLARFVAEDGAVRFASTAYLLRAGAVH